VDGDTNGRRDVFVRSITDVHVDGLAFALGSFSGGDPLRIEGSDLATFGECQVTFGGAAATVLSAAPEHVIVRTPAGVGTVDVRVSNRGGAFVLPAAFTYVSPLLAVRYGNVGAASGERETSLRAYPVTEDPVTRVTTTHVGTWVSVYFDPPDATPLA